MRKDKKKLRELGKDLLIAALVVSALLLGRASGILGSLLPDGVTGIFTGLGGSTPGETTESGAVTAAAVPFAAAVTGSVGMRYGLTYGEERVAELYGRFSAALGEALGSSGTPEAITEAQWRDALDGPGVYFDFLYEQPLSVLAVWLGTEITGGASSHTARRICLAPEGDGLTLYYLRERDYSFYRCETALSASAFAQWLEAYTPNGAAFAWELSDDESLDPYALLETGLLTLPVVTASNPCRETVSAADLQALFGFTVALSYAESDGTVVYVEGDATLRVSPAGTVSYRCAEGGLGLGPEGMSTQAAVEAARALCQRGPGSGSGAGSLGLSGVRYDQATEAYIICFDYAVDGIPVVLPDGPAVELTIAGGTLREAVMRFRCYTPEEETCTPLPAEQALAAVCAKGGGEPLLAYVDGQGAVELQWLAA